MAATAVAAVRETVVVHPPASPFAELLRRSKFATYDPNIRQTYSAAPANAHRGDWGLKRPIALRRKNAFISLSSFEHPAHFTEWNHAESQVRFIRRIEEMGVKPETVVGTPWYKSLGKAKTDILLDSEFCPGESNVMETKRQLTAVPFDALGKRGPGAYGPKREPAKRDEGTEIYVTENIDAMSTKEFDRYLEKLRSLRPAFQEHIQKQNADFSTKSLYALAQNAERGFHRKFMMEHMSTEYKDRSLQKIEPQPHPNAALTYTRPTALETVLWTKPQPGIILNAYVEGDRHTHRGTPQKPPPQKPQKYVASFGGLAAIINAGGSKVPLLDVASDVGVHKELIKDSIADLRLLPRGGLRLQVPPRVVGTKPQGLKGVRLLAEVTMELAQENHNQDNPHPLGSRDYIAEKGVTNKAQPANFLLVPKPKAWNSFSIKIDRPAHEVINALSNIVKGKKLQGTDEDL